MYRSYGNVTGGSQQSYSGAGAGSSHTGLPQESQKLPGERTGRFVPSLDAITSSQDLQWMVQPSLLSAPGLTGRPPRPPFPPPPGPRSLPPHSSQSHLLRPGVIRAVGGTGVPSRRRNDELLSPEELEKRKIRRERNKMAAAKCRNRRRELTECLQKETDQLESEKSQLQKEVAELQKEKEKLELVLEAHRPICKIRNSDSDSDSDPGLGPSILKAAKTNTNNPNKHAHSPKCHPRTEKPKPKITLPPAPYISSTLSVQPSESESLHTPILISTPSLTPFTASLVFTYPSASLEANSVAPPLPLLLIYTWYGPAISKPPALWYSPSP
ncbi:hypothetical protein AGOR_G00075380 [Albula goreensis]|uniref:BZIP domain-containing protein n=1 Tax=Albula goreensis TaxID=1534307 RepID=A0A8T3DNT6_9TELE|nr:hypothetical protein AGOR_G00075380 [Albula goreensis]